jgi:hypothetical protein
MPALFVTVKIRVSSWVVVAYTCNPIYSGGSWFEASPGKQFTRPYLEKTHHNTGLMEWLKL